MSMIKVEYDTVKKEAYATIDGKPLENLHSIYCGHSHSDEDGNPKFSFEMSTMEMDEENKMMKTHRVMATLKNASLTTETDKKDALYKAIAHRVFPSA